jgi:hypothetical protein
MSLQPVIASYSDASCRVIRSLLDNRALAAVAHVTSSPLSAAELDPDLCSEMMEMHVLREHAGLVGLDTSVFLEENIHRIS